MNKYSMEICLSMLLVSSLGLADPFGNTCLSLSNSVPNTSAETTKVEAKEESLKETENTAEMQAKETQTTEYTVAAGDCLSSIAEKLLGNKFLWQEIIELNKEKYPSLISNPNLIYCGWTLAIPAKDEKASSDKVVFSKPCDVAVKVVKTPESISKSSAETAVSKNETTIKSTSNTSSSVSGKPIITADSRVLHIGDSHSCGVYGKTIDSLMRETGATVNTVGVAGSNPTYFMNGTTTKCGYYSKDASGKVTEPYWSTPMKTPLLADLISTYKPSVLVVSLGANMVGYGESSIRNQIKSIADKAKAANCKLVWVGPPDSRIQDKNQVNQLYSILKSEIKNYNGELIDSRQYTEYPSSGGDGLHYSGSEGTATAKTWANSVMNAVQGK